MTKPSTGFHIQILPSTQEAYRNLAVVEVLSKVLMASKNDAHKATMELYATMRQAIAMKLGSIPLEDGTPGEEGKDQAEDAKAAAGTKEGEVQETPAMFEQFIPHPSAKTPTGAGPPAAATPTSTEPPALAAGPSGSSAAIAAAGVDVAAVADEKQKMPENTADVLQEEPAAAGEGTEAKDAVAEEEQRMPENRADLPQEGQPAAAGTGTEAKDAAAEEEQNMPENTEEVPAAGAGTEAKQAIAEVDQQQTTSDPPPADPPAAEPNQEKPPAAAAAGAGTEAQDVTAKEDQKNPENPEEDVTAKEDPPPAELPAAEPMIVDAEAAPKGTEPMSVDADAKAEVAPDAAKPVAERPVAKKQRVE